MVQTPYGGSQSASILTDPNHKGRQAVPNTPASTVCDN